MIKNIRYHKHLKETRKHMNKKPRIASAMYQARNITKNIHRQPQNYYNRTNIHNAHILTVPRIITHYNSFSRTECSRIIDPQIILNKTVNPAQTIGFIMTRHINSEKTSKYWLLSYMSIRKYYPNNKIIIIDDNSEQKYIDQQFEILLYNTIIINSEYHKRGELLPYIYFINNKWFDTAVIIHDSVFINRLIDFRVKNYKSLWFWGGEENFRQDGDKLLQVFNNNKTLLQFRYDKRNWVSCFGGMSAITHDYLIQLHYKYDFFRLIPHIKDRYSRIVFENVLGTILHAHDINSESSYLLGDIETYCKYETSYDEINTLRHLPIIKIWTGR